jgi:hypothetical protein
MFGRNTRVLVAYILRIREVRGLLKFQKSKEGHGWEMKVRSFHMLDCVMFLIKSARKIEVL